MKRLIYTTAFLCALATPLLAQETRSYSSNVDFDRGTLFNVNHDVSGELRLNSSLSTFPVMWIANAGEDTVSKIDTETGQELARYRTSFGPAGQAGYNKSLGNAYQGAAPSRTAVDRDGNVYVANRHFDNKKPAIVKILASGGVDRNGNGVIDTATGSTPFSMADLDNDGYIDDNEIRDERVEWVRYYGDANALGRSLTLDVDGNIWLGTYNTRRYYKIDPVSGAVLANVNTNVTNYGAVVDKDGILWGATLGSNLVKLNTRTLAVTVYNHANYGGNYGIAIGNGKVYLGGMSCAPLVFDPVTASFSRISAGTPGRPCYSASGLAVDSQGNIYVRSNRGGVAKLDPSGATIWESPNQPGGSGGGIGIAIDSSGNAWLISMTATRNLQKFRGTNGQALGVYSAGNTPYTYTDCTGLSSFNSTAASGKWTVVQDAGGVGVHWGRVNWNTEAEALVPAGASIVVDARASDTIAGLGSRQFTPMPKNQFLAEASELVGRFLEVRVTLTANSQNQSPVLSDIHVEASRDTTPPTVTAPPDASFQCASQVPAGDVGTATASDNRGTPSVTVAETTNGGAGSSASPLVITRTWTATDAAGNSASDSQTITVIDTTEPVISLSGAATVEVECHTSYSDAGASATDNCGGVVAVVTSGSVDVNTPGTYTITYSATDAAGNAAASVSRTIVVKDSQKPTVTLAGAADVTVECHSAYVEQGATAADACAGDLSSSVVISGQVVANTVGVYTITYTATDANGNSNSAQRTVRVVDTTKPVITVNDGAGVVECHTSYTDAGASANDACSGDVAVTPSGAVNADIPGLYTITYTAVDASGNTATATRSVTVRDTTTPVLTLNGADNVVVECHTDYVDAGAKADDECAGDLTSTISVSNGVNVNIPGAYTVVYSVVDGSGNASQAVRNVIVQDTTAPVLSLVGPSSVVHECHLPYVDAGATASDSCAGDLTAAVLVGGSVDANTPGTYTLTFMVSDASGNAAQSITRTVEVRDTQKPVIALNGGDVTHECHDSYTDAGAVATDACAGTVPVTVSGSVNVNVPGTYTLTYSAVDASGNAADAVTRTVTVRDTTAPVPTVDALPAITGQCSVTVASVPTADDACGGTKNGTTTDPTTYSQQGTYTITWTYEDEAGNRSTQSQTVIVKDTTAPNVQTPAPVSEVTTECQFAVPQFNVVADDNCAPVGALQVVQSPLAGTVVNLGSHVVKITVTDAVGNITVVSTTFSLSNDAPVVSAGGPYAVNEGSSVALVPSGTDAGGPVTFAWDLNNDGVFETAAPASFDASQLDDGTNAIAVEGRDKCGIPAAAATTVRVNNVAPVTTITAPTAESGLLFKKGDTVAVTASFSDAGTKDTHSCMVNWDNGSGAVAGVLNQSARTCTSSLQLNAAGVYSVNVSVTDDDGGVGTSTVMIVVYDPAAGFVTGGGWLISPAGAYAADASLAGKAHFAFVSKYQKGNSVPTGETNFRFEAGSFRFDSTRYEWMVISGRKAQYRGVGTVNGAGDYGFLLTAYDENLPGGDGQDKFRIKIWDRSQGNRVVYDNRMNQSDDMDASNPQNIGAGSIVIHTGK